ncbi:hypothetical protein HWV62_25138 [Athelia sp. TMB]|nr:hypothetical protein HWV62_25138 [Athelia sp. TMB]
MSLNMPARTPHSNNRSAPYPPAGSRTFNPVTPQNREGSFGSSFDDYSTSPSFGSANTSLQSQSSFEDPTQSFNNQSFGQEQSAYLVTKLVSRENLDDERRRRAHEFHIANKDMKLTASYAQGLAIDQKLDLMLQRLTMQSDEVAAVRVLVNAAWALTPAQKSLMQDLLEHFLIKATTSYKNIIRNAEVMSKYHLENYSTEDIIKRTINIYLVKTLVAVKSKYRKKLFKLVNAHVPLDSLSLLLVNQFHMTPRPSPIGNNILATVALHRRVAGPLAPKKNAKGADTGFWDKLDEEMLKLVKANGDDRKDARWLEWETNIIATDREKFTDDNSISTDEEPEPEADADDAM